jgi:hypothetical protein
MVKKEDFIKAYNKYNGNIPKIAEKLNMLPNTAYKARQRYLEANNPVKIVNKTESVVNKIRVKVNTQMYPEALTNFIKDMQKDGKTITLTVS